MKHALDVLSTWGCPWHGLIQGGQLALPNAEQLAMRQPQGPGYEQGNTHLIALPTAPVTERTPEQADADEAAGMQWLNQALIAGDQIHGRPIGQGCWVYHDADSTNWLVETTLQNAGPAQTDCTVTLRRFGVFGGEPESHEYTLPVVGVEAARSWWGLNPSNVQVRMYSAHPDGRAAVFAVLGLHNGSTEWRPIAWLEMTLTGAAAACTVAQVVLHDAAATRGTETDYDGGQFGAELVRYGLVTTTAIEDDTVESYPACSGTFTQTDSYSFEPTGTETGWLAFPGSGYTQRAAWIGCIVGVVYSAAGTRQTITLDGECDWTLDATALTPETNTDRVYSYNVISSGGACVREVIETTAGEFVISQTVTTTAVGTLTYRVDGVAAASESVTYQTVRTGRLAYVLGDFPGGVGAASSATESFDWVTTRDTGHSATASGSGAASSSGTLGSHWRGLDIGADMIRQPYVLSQYLSPEPDELPGFFLHAQRYSNGVYGMQRETRQLNNAYPWAYEYTATAATPAGGAALPVLTYSRASAADPLLPAYGSYNPITGAVARALNTPICWT